MKVNTNSGDFIYTVSYISSFVLSLFLVYNIIFRLVLYNETKLKLQKRFKFITEWTWIIWMAFKTFLGSTESMYDIITNYLSNCEKTPRDIWIGYFHVVYVNKPEDLQVVLNSSHALEKGQLYKFLKRGLGEGLITGPVSKWRKNRRLISPIFSSRFLENYYDIFNDKTRELIKKLESFSDTNEYFDLWVPISTTTFSMIWDVAIGADTPIDEKDKFDCINSIVRVSEAYSYRILRLWLYPVFMFKTWLKFAGYWKFFDEAREIPRRILQKKREVFEKKKHLLAKNMLDDKFTSLVDSLLRLNEEGAGFSDNDICNEIVTMLVAGSETNALTVSFTLIMLAMNPHFQDKVYKEITEVLGEKDKYIDVNDVNKMEYLDQCIKETLRLFPPIPFTLRLATNDFKINEEFYIRAGTHIIIPPLMVHRDSTVYSNPLLWNPDNFSAEQVDKRHKYSFLAFSGGPRGCVGGKYALAAIKIILAMILKKFWVTTEATMGDMKIKLEIVARSANGYKIKFYSRKKN